MSTPPGSNPYAAPQAVVSRPSETFDGNFIPNGRSVGAGQGASWIGTGWNLFMRAPMMWVLLFIVLFIMIMIMAFIPLLGSIAINLLMPFFLGGVMLGCRELQQGGELRIDHLFSAKEKLGDLVLVGLIYLGAFILVYIALAIIFMVFFGFTALAAIFGGGGDASSAIALGGLGIGMVLFFLLAMAVSIPILMAYWFAPSLVVFHDMKPFDAMKMSFKACIKNIVPFLIYGLIGLLLTVLIVITFGLGMLVISPVLMASIYASYHDIFITE
ncbi:BPSS1780 family membrane protein [Chitinivorax sp. B]|uniref:BPSS1780 family membrane protein n=1 Tax=Chitinivorax sp. B TaxID=2502235 RepID=UPI0010F4E400|nr:BPSS1780 family membrane protein [Chitinivorax sp. B]